MGIKPRPSRTLELGRSTSSIPASPLPLSPCPPAGGSDPHLHLTRLGSYQSTVNYARLPDGSVKLTSKYEKTPSRQATLIN